jgi:hypothetical protein
MKRKFNAPKAIQKLKPRNKTHKLLIIIVLVLVLIVSGTAYAFSNDVFQKSKKCDTNGCFQEAFLKCNKAHLQQTNPFSSKGAEPYYQIKGGTPSKCRMSLSYNDGEKDLEMTCTYKDTARYNSDTGDEFIDAESEQEDRILMGQHVDCGGSLYKSLKDQATANPDYKTMFSLPSKYGTE